MPISRANGVDIWYEVAGEGPAMVFVHANPFDHDLWMYQAAHFSTWFKVVGIDIRGYGRSAKVTAPYSLKDMCSDVIGVIGEGRSTKVFPVAIARGIIQPIGIMAGKLKGAMPAKTPSGSR